MLTLTTFHDNDDVEFNEAILNDAILEITRLIRLNANDFRIVIDITSDNIDYKLYKNAITYNFLKIGYKVVNYPTFLYIDWSRVNLYQQVFTIRATLESLGDSFTAFDLYASLTESYDLRRVTYRTLEYQVNREIKNMISYGLSEKLITFGLQTTMDSVLLNNMFAPELALYANKNPDVHLTFFDGGNLLITRNKPAELYTDIPLRVMFGTNLT